MPGPAPFHGARAGAPEGTAARFARAGDRRIRAVLAPPGRRGTVLVLPGRTEYAEKYGRAMARLAGMGFGSVAIDWRGQGLSDRPGGTTALGHVTDFAEYQADLAAVLALPEVAALPGPRFLLAHSMGGCIGLRALLAGLPARAAVFSAPMWGIALSPLMRAVARLVAEAGSALGLGRTHAPAGGPDPYVLSQPFAGNVLTSDPSEWERMRADLAAVPGLALGGPSLAWLRAALRETAALARRPAPDLPALALLGAEEAVVSPRAIRARMARWPGGRLVVLPGARHELLMEAPAIRERAWAEIGSFLDGHA